MERPGNLHTVGEETSDMYVDPSDEGMNDRMMEMGRGFSQSGTGMEMVFRLAVDLGPRTIAAIRGHERFTSACHKFYTLRLLLNNRVTFVLASS